MKATAQNYTINMGYSFEAEGIISSKIITVHTFDYYVTFKDEDGTVMKKETVDYYQSATPPEIPEFFEKDNTICQFTGWLGDSYQTINTGAQYRTVTASYKKIGKLSGQGTQQSPYLIYSASDWDIITIYCKMNYAESKFFKLMNDISVDTMVGTENIPFNGNFDGNQKKLTFNCTANGDYTAPFRFVEGSEDNHASISNLNFESNITSSDSHKYASGLIACQKGWVDVTNCHAAVNISSTCMSGYFNVYASGMVGQAYQDGTLTVKGCTVTGTISTDGKYAAGVVGAVNGTARIEDTLSSVTINSSTWQDGTHGGFIGINEGEKLSNRIY